MRPDAIAEMRAGVTGLAPVPAGRFFVTRPDVEQKEVADDDNHRDREDTPEKRERKFSSAGVFNWLMKRQHGL